VKKLDLLFVFALLTMSIAGCSKEKCTVCPDDQPEPEKEYYFLYSFGGGYTEGWVYTYSTKTGKPVDSTRYGKLPFFDARFSKDGKRVYYSVRDAGNEATWIADFASGDTLAIVQGISGRWLTLSPDERFLLVSGSPTLSLLRLPSLEVAYSRQQGDSWKDAAIHPFKNLAYVPHGNEDSLLILDFTEETITDRKIQLLNKVGAPVGSYYAAISRDGRILILSCRELPLGATYLQLRDSETLELLYEYYPARTTAYVHPDGLRIFFVEPWRDQGGIPGAVWELNLHTLLMRRILNSVDFTGPWPFYGLDVLDMDFTPDGRFAYFIGGDQGLYYGPIIKYDLDNYRIVDAVYPTPGIAQRIRFNPQAVKN